MTTDALGGEPLAVKLPDGSSLVARIAIHRSMGADERKAILMLIDGLDYKLPASYPVAEIALRSVFSAVKIGMTILTITSHVFEYRFDVAFLAGNVQV